ncbi:transcriptional regulator, partial [Staphylococcus xylosus]|nr:transcriptional regulator [Staphylococcus xylosus]
MKFSSKLSDGVHILAYVDIYRNGDLSSAAIAGSIESNPSLV